MDSTYSPHSPDPPSVLTSSPKAQQYNRQPSISRLPYAPRSPTIPFVGSNSLDQNTFSYTPNSYPTQLASSSTGSFDSSGDFLSREIRPTPLSIPSAGFPNTPNLIPISPRNPRASLPSQVLYRTVPCAESDKFYQDHRNLSGQTQFLPENPKDWVSSSKTSADHSTMKSCRGSREKYQRKSSSAASLMPHYADPNPQNIEIKTKFPVARIKRIMQADEEVGKVAQVTPVAVSKALELFMIALVTGAADKAREKGSKKVNAQHLKLVVDGQPERFDFLADIVGRCGEGSENTSGEHSKANRKRKEESESASDEEREKIKKKGRGRKKKSGD